MRGSLPRLLGALVLALAFLAGSQGPKARLYVFYPSFARPLAIQEALAQRCPGLSITVFGRQADFQAKVAADAPEAILSLPPVIAQHADYSAMLQGLRQGAPAEPYVLVSLDQAADPAKLDGAAVGVVGLLERKAMAGFVATLLPGAPRLDRVTKVEDLLPLLTFRTVAAILVSEAVAREFSHKSQAKLVTTRLEGRVGLVSLAVRRGAAEAEAVRALKALRGPELELLGVDAWR